MKRILFLILSILLFIFAFVMSKPVDTELMNAFISPSSPEQKRLVKLANLSSKRVNVIFEGETIEEVDDLAANFPYRRRDYSEIIDVYRNYPANFLTENTRKLLKGKNYSLVEQQALERLYNPLGFFIAPPDKDPFLFATEFVLNNAAASNNRIEEFDGKYYLLLSMEIKNRKELENIIEKAKNKNIYLSGTPVHSYFAAKKSNLEINIICIITIFVLFGLCKFYFKSAKVLIPIALACGFGFLCGYLVSELIFPELHILTFVFSTSLIGISLDYSLHYFLSGNEAGFKKSLTSSMLTTVIAFLALLFANIEVLRQIAIFTSVGLIGVYLFVVIIFPAMVKFGSSGSFPRIKIPEKYLYILIIIVVLAGIFRVKFEDNIKNLYIPPPALVKSETIYKNVFSPQNPEFIFFSGNSVEEILVSEEESGFENAVGLCSFISSEKRQRENQELVRELYMSTLSRYESISGVKTVPFNAGNRGAEIYPEVYSPDKFPPLPEFMLDKNTSFVMLKSHVSGSFNLADEMSKILRNMRHECLVLLPAVFCVLFIFLSFIYGIKKAVRISTPPLAGILFTVSLLSLSGVYLNLFHILGLFLIIGFSLDYSIFRINGGKKSKDAVFMSAFSTSLSFLLLAFTSFKLISSLGFTLFVGIFVSYILSLLVIKSDCEEF